VRLDDGKRRKNRVDPASTTSQGGEASGDGHRGTEPSSAKREPQSPANTNELMEEVCQRENLLKAIKRVRANKGSPGVDGMNVNELEGYLKEHWPAIKGKLFGGTYEPQPVRRVEIPKPGGGVRKLGSSSTG
jgi:RNA-directed DNA polymerase